MSGGDEGDPGQRRPWVEGPAGQGWLGLGDDDLLYRIESLPPDHGDDLSLLDVVRSERHFFVRQEAAKRIRDPELLKAHSEDRHIGQILVRGLTRREDVLYLQKLVRESRYLEVRKAAEVQLGHLERRLRGE